MAGGQTHRLRETSDADQLQQSNQQHRPQHTCENNDSFASRRWYVGLREQVGGHRSPGRGNERTAQVNLPQQHRDHLPPIPPGVLPYPLRQVLNVKSTPHIAERARGHTTAAAKWPNRNKVKSQVSPAATVRRLPWGPPSRRRAAGHRDALWLAGCTGLGISSLADAHARRHPAVNARPRHRSRPVAPVGKEISADGWMGTTVERSGPPRTPQRWSCSAESREARPDTQPPLPAFNVSVMDAEGVMRQRRFTWPARTLRWWQMWAIRHCRTNSLLRTGPSCWTRPGCTPSIGAAIRRSRLSCGCGSRSSAPRRKTGPGCGFSSRWRATPRIGRQLGIRLRRAMVRELPLASSRAGRAA
jgi:hypothetical protein